MNRVPEAKECLELFMLRVAEMRKLQQRYFNGERKLFVECKKAEARVDAALDRPMNFGYSMHHFENYEQLKLL
jgi:hypothetical protein